MLPYIAYAIGPAAFGVQTEARIEQGRSGRVQDRDGDLPRRAVAVEEIAAAVARRYDIDPAVLKAHGHHAGPAKAAVVALASRLANLNGRMIGQHYGIGSAAIVAIHRWLADRGRGDENRRFAHKATGPDAKKPPIIAPPACASCGNCAGNHKGRLAVITAVDDGSVHHGRSAALVEDDESFSWRKIAVKGKSSNPIYVGIGPRSNGPCPRTRPFAVPITPTNRKPAPEHCCTAQASPHQPGSQTYTARIELLADSIAARSRLIHARRPRILTTTRAAVISFAPAP